MLRVLAKVFGPRLIPLLQKRMILHDEPAEATLTRTVTRDGDRLRVVDELSSPTPISTVRAAPKYSLRHVASSMYFRDEEYASAGLSGELPVERVGGTHVVHRTRTWDLASGRELGSDD